MLKVFIFSRRAS